MDKVLIATPDGAERASIVSLLDPRQYDTSSAGDLMTALARIAIDPPDLLVTIVHEGGFNGLPLVMSGYA